MLPTMSATEFTTLDRILQVHESELIEDALAELPSFVVERQPRVMFENAGHSLLRWPMFGRPPRVSAWSSARCRSTCSPSASSTWTSCEPIHFWQGAER